MEYVCALAEKERGGSSIVGVNLVKAVEERAEYRPYFLNFKYQRGD
jgi:hypothetical protein